MWNDAFRGKTVLVTGHTGFKGSWLAIWLHKLGARVVGFGNRPPTDPSNYVRSHVADLLERDIDGDVRDLAAVETAVRETRPDIVMHLAAQPIVSVGYTDPVGTFAANVMGTAHVLEAVRKLGKPCAVVVVSSDKCYENREQVWGYRESDPMGGHDPYSASKGCTELVVSSYLRSFFDPAQLKDHGVALASARAGNVIGGGDWAKDRLVVDLMMSLTQGHQMVLRNPNAIRPWQHVLEPLSGYLMLAANLGASDGAAYAKPWNFGPHARSAVSVRDFTTQLIEYWGDKDCAISFANGAKNHEAQLLRLSIDQATAELGWQPVWSVRDAIERTCDWYRAEAAGDAASMLSQCLSDIDAYELAMADGAR